VAIIAIDRSNQGCRATGEQIAGARFRALKRQNRRLEATVLVQPGTIPSLRRTV
jgi:hypothetical protein